MKKLSRQAAYSRREYKKRRYEGVPDEKQRLRQLLYCAKSNAKRHGVQFSITVDDVELPLFCPVLGFMLEFRGPPFSPWLPSLDRLRPELGYVPGNVRIISWRANRLKADCTNPSELRAIADYIEKGLDVAGFTGR